MAESIKELQQKAALKQSLETKLNELYNQRREYDRKAISLRVAFSLEQDDVNKLEERSLRNYFYHAFGMMDEKINRHRQEAQAAKLKLEAGEAELAGIDVDIAEIQSQLAQVRIAQQLLEQAMKDRRSELKAAGTEAGMQILELEQEIAGLEVRKKEIKEAISAGYSARATADHILQELNSADGWNTWDLIGGGGIITHMEKHGHLDEAQDLVGELQSRLRRFKTELADIQISANVQVNVDSFLRFADYFFDGLFADLTVQSRIERSYSSVEHTRNQINRALDKLNEMEKSTELEIRNLKYRLDELVANA